METTQLLVLMGILAAVGKYVSEWLFGKKLDAKRMQGAAIAISLALLGGCWTVAKYAPDLGAPELAFLAEQSLLTVLIGGLMSGLASNGVHDAVASLRKKR